MREYDLPFEDIFKGLQPTRVMRKGQVMLGDCHNIEPVRGDDYQLHKQVIDLDTDDYDWKNA